MAKIMLGGVPLADWQPVRDQLKYRIAGAEGPAWLAALKRFLRKENPWEVERRRVVVLRVPEAPRRIIIDCDARPFLPDGWDIRPEDQIASRVLGTFEFDPARVAFYLEEEQKTGTIKGTDLRTSLEGKLVLPANVLDAFRANTAMIPDSWKKDAVGNTRYIHFFL